MADDWRAERCGHNYPITACPAKRCEARNAVTQLARAEKVIQVARELLQHRLPRTGKVLQLKQALAEYDRPSAPPDGSAELG